MGCSLLAGEGGRREATGAGMNEASSADGRRGGGGRFAFPRCLLLLTLIAAGPTPEQLQDAERAKAADIAAQQSALAAASNAAEQERQLSQARVDAAAKLRVAEDALAQASAGIADLTQHFVAVLAIEDGS